jgi:hypothetical protein
MRILNLKCLLPGFFAIWFSSQALVAQTSRQDPIGATQASASAGFVDCFSLKIDATRVALLKRHLDAIWHKTVESISFSIIEEFASESRLTDGTTANVRVDALLSHPQLDAEFVLICPKGLTEQKEEFGTQDLNITADGSLQFLGEMPIVLTDRYSAMIHSYTPQMAGLAERLPQLVAETQNAQFRHLSSITANPQQLGKSLLRHSINAYRAELLADAQRRNNDTDFLYECRSVTQRGLVSLLDTFFNDIQSLECSLDWSQDDHSLTITARIVARNKSPLDQYIATIGSTGNRSLSWLHPDHTSFITTSLPIPDLIRDALPQIANTTAAGLKEELGLSEHGVQQTILLVNQFSEQGFAETLIQAIPSPDGSTAVIGMVPLQGDISFSPTLLELVSTATDSPWETSVTDIDGWPVHRIHKPATDFNISSDLYLIATDHCLGWMAGSEETLSIFENVVQRQYSPDETGNRFRRSALAARTTLSQMSASFFDGEISEFVPPTAADADTPRDQIEVVIDTEPHCLLLTARFQADASQLGICVFDLALEEFLDWFQELD